MKVNVPSTNLDAIIYAISDNPLLPDQILRDQFKMLISNQPHWKATPLPITKRIPGRLSLGGIDF